jgi:hypothetical protein
LATKLVLLFETNAFDNTIICGYQSQHWSPPHAHNTAHTKDAANQGARLPGTPSAWHQVNVTLRQPSKAKPLHRRFI